MVYHGNYMANHTTTMVNFYFNQLKHRHFLDLTHSQTVPIFPSPSVFSLSSSMLHEVDMSPRYDILVWYLSSVTDKRHCRVDKWTSEMRIAWLLPSPRQEPLFSPVVRLLSSLLGDDHTVDWLEKLRLCEDPIC